jgi:hypothetical protein
VSKTTGRQKGRQAGRQIDMKEKTQTYTTKSKQSGIQNDNSKYAKIKL